MRRRLPEVQAWSALSPLARRSIKATAWTGLGLLLVVLFGVWQWSALVIAAVVLVLVIPNWSRVTIGGRRIGRWFLPLAVLALAITYPFYANSPTGVNPGLPQLPVFGTFPLMSTMVNMGIFTMMALGLNFVV
ncbi:MAG TPA: hypothetical protein VGG88_11835, partial [Gaiellaceae bacterium]